MVQGAMDADPIDPGRKTCAEIDIKSPDPIVKLEKRILDDVFRILAGMNIAKRQAEQTSGMSEKKRFQSGGISILG